jgi:ADP-ribose pyrophosphatase
MKYKFNLLDKEIIYQGFHSIELLKFNFNKFSGELSNNVSREVFQRKPCVGVIPFDPIRQEIILIEQIRPGPITNNHPTPWLLEIVAGIVDENEQAEITVLREAKEEANCNITQIIPIYEYYVSPGCSSEIIKLYCGITDTTHAGGIYGLSDENEDIKVHVVKLQDAFTMLNSGKIINAATIIAMQWLLINHHKIS